MAVEQTDFELSAISPLSADDIYVAAAGGVSSAIGNTTLGAIKTFVLDGLDVADVANAANEVHTHDHNDITDWDTELNLKLDVGASIPISQVTGLQTALDGKMASDATTAYGDLTGLSTDVMEALGAADYAELRSLQSLGDLALISWGDTMADDAQTSDYFVAARSGSAGSPVTVTGSQMAAMVLAEATIDSIDGLTAALGAKMASDAEIPQSQITNLVSDLAAKLGSSDEIPQSQVTDLVADLAAKLGASDPIPQSQVTDLASTLAALTIPIAQISDAGTGTGGGADVLAAADAAAIRTLLGLGTAALSATGDFLASVGDIDVSALSGISDYMLAIMSVVDAEELASQLGFADVARTGSAADLLSGNLLYARLPTSVVSGEWTPTCTGISNVTGTPTANVCRYIRMGNIVGVSGLMSVDPTSTSPTNTTVRFTPPVASAFTDAAGATGTVSTGGAADSAGGALYSNAANDQLELSFLSGSGSAHLISFSGHYTII